MKIPEYFRFNAIENVRCAINLCVDMAQEIEEQPTYFKWLVITTHDMLQGAMVCALSGSDNAGALKKNHQKKLRRWYLERRQNPDAPYPDLGKAPLADFKELLKRAQKKERSGSGTVEPLRLDEQEKEHLDYLHKLRNTFVHFENMSWSIESDGLPQVLNVALVATKSLINEPQVRVQLEDNALQQMESDLSKIQSLLKKWHE